MTGVHRITVGDSERDPLLYLALGARAWIERIDAFLERYAPPEAGDGDGSDDRAARPTTDDERAALPVTDDIAVVLGVLAVRARLLRALESTPDPVGHTDAAGHDAEACPLPGWLR